MKRPEDMNTIKIFVGVSRRRPSSETAQGAELALLARQDPQLIRRLEQLAKNRRSLRILSRVANTVHKTSGNKTVAFRRVGISDVQTVLKNDIFIVRRFSKLAQEQLQVILDIDPHDPKQEASYAENVDSRFFS